jgi:hypothetical protein
MGDLTNLTMPRDAHILGKRGSYVIKVNADSTGSHLADAVKKVESIEFISGHSIVKAIFERNDKQTSIY